MTTIQIAYTESKEAVARVESLLEQIAMRDPNWNGAEFEIERADYTCIPNDDSHDAVRLLNKIQSALQGE